MKQRKPLIWIIFIATFLMACNFSYYASAVPEDTTQIQSQSTSTRALATIAQDATPTATPFQPVPPTPTYIPTAFPTPVPTATPAPAPSSPPVQEGGVSAQPINHPQDQVNILLLGSDQRIGEIGFRTDTIVLLSINTRNKTASMVSFPRDLYVYIPGWTYQRINTAMYHGGFPLLAQTFEYNFGVRLDYHVLVGLNAFIETIDSLGGIDVHVGQTLSDHRTAFGYYTVKAGNVHMDGSTALWYVRSRYTTSDFDRTRRQQEVVQALASRLLSLDALEKGDELYDIYSKHVSSDMKWIDIAPLLPVAAQVGDPSNIQHYYIGPGQVIPWTTPGGAQVLLPQEYAVHAVLQQALGIP